MGFIDKIMDDVLGDPFGSYEAEAAAKGAASTQAQAADAGIEEQRRQFDVSRQILDPYVQAGTGALGDVSRFTGGYDAAMPTLEGLMGAGESAMPRLTQAGATGFDASQMQRALSGLNGPEAQQAAYDQVSSDPAVTEMMRQGEEAMLANASATGGLRGGNLQGAMAQFRPAILANAINQKFAQLSPMAATGTNVDQYLTGTGGTVAQNLYGSGQQATTNLAQLGQSAAAGQAAGAMQTGANISSLLADKGAAQAGGMMASGSGRAGAVNPMVKLGLAFL